ncbi:MAG: putative bifunctional diguanylate cyclase/phosphodiesterase [Acidimicrobiales bacterium]
MVRRRTPIDILTEARDQLRLDRVTTDGGDLDHQIELCQIMWWIRHLALGAGLVLVADGRPLTATALAACFGLHRFSRRGTDGAAGTALADGVLLIAFAALGLEPWLVLVWVISGLGWAATFRPVAALSSYLLLVGGVGVLVVRGDLPGPAVSLAVFCIGSFLLLLRAVRLNIGGRAAEAQQQRINDTVDVVLWEEIPGLDGAKRVSGAAERLLGYPAHHWARPGFWRSLLHEDDAATLDQRIRPHVEARRDHAVTMRLRHADGSWRWIESRVSSNRDRHGNHRSFVGVMIDRTDQREAEAEALRFGEMVASSPIGQLLLARGDSGMLVLAANQTSRSILGPALHAVEEGAGELPGDLQTLVGRIAEDGETRMIEFRAPDERIFQVTGRCIERTMISLDFLDITERVTAAARLEVEANRDALTGLANRRNFTERLARELADASASTALLQIDLDNFKEINDALGHETGDEVLRVVAGRMLSAVRDGGHVARLGGDEFGVILPGTDAATAEEVCQRVLDSLRQPLVHAELMLRVDASIGLAVAPDQTSDHVELARHADIAMYHAKRRGGGWSRYDKRYDRASTDRLAMVGELGRAIAEGELCLHHQPFVEPATGQVRGAEALVRWQHPQRGLIPPGDFIELAEISGQIDALTQWVVERALAENAGRGLEFVSLNLSARNLLNDQLVDSMAAAIETIGSDCGVVVVEITESTIIEDFDQAVRVLESLRSLGIQVWIDDFGTGHSSLARLTALPIDGVKIDRAFIDASTRSREGRIVLENLIEMVHELGLRSIAEGIETAEQLDVVRSLGCDLAQGFHLAEPAPYPIASALPDPLTADQGPWRSIGPDPTMTSWGTADAANMTPVTAGS